MLLVMGYDGREKFDEFFTVYYVHLLGICVVRINSWRRYLVIYAYASVFVLELDDFES
jgi:hypothetical protein